MTETHSEIEPFQPQEILIVRDLETLRAIAEPTRLQIMEVLELQVASSKQIARKLGTTNSKLYYHLDLLEKVGLIKVVGSATTRNLTEKYYRAVAKRIEISREVLAGAGVDKEAMNELLSSSSLASIDTTRLEIQRGLVAKTRGTFSEGRVNLYLSEAQASELWERLTKIIEEYQQEVPVSNDSQAIRHVFAAFLYPYTDEDDTIS